MPQHRPVIAHVLHVLRLAGAEVLAADLARRLSNQYRFVFLCLDEVGPLGQQLATEGFDVVGLDRQPGLDWSVARRIRQAIARYRIDLLHAHQYTPFFYASVARRFSAKPPVLFTEHGRHYPDARRFKRVIANKFLLRPHDRVTAVGRFVKQALIDNEGVSSNRIQVIHNGVDPTQFDDPNPAQARVAIREKLGITPDQPVILQVARFHPVKDHTTAIQAVACAAKQVPNLLLLLAGDGQDQPKIQSLVNELNLTQHVRFLGVRQDIAQLMIAADVFLLSSLSEGVSVTLLEAMASSLPVAATAVGGNPEVVEDGRTGLLSPRQDPISLGNNLVRLLNDTPLCHRFGHAARDRLMQLFTQQQMHDAYSQLYSRLLSP